MEYIWALMSIGGVFLLACCSPGPVFMLITSTAASATCRSGVFIGLGVAAATFTWASLTALGLGLLLSSVVWLHTAIKITGGLYSDLAWTSRFDTVVGWRYEQPIFLSDRIERLESSASRVRCQHN